MVNVGDPAPDFSLLSHDGGEVRLEDLLGRKQVVLFFYPKANTGGWTNEAKAFTGLYSRFAQAGAEVFGVSADSPSTNAGFAAKEGISVSGLLTDQGWALLKAFGERTSGDKVFKRITFVIGLDGLVKLAYYYKGSGDAASHATEALKAVESAA